MLIFDDIYTWEGPEVEDHALWIMSCHLWIIDMSLSNPDVEFMKPKIVVASDQSEGPRRHICAETLGRQIYQDFQLDIKRTLWVEFDPGLPSKAAVAELRPKYHDGNETIYSISWRKLMKSERDIIRQYIPRLGL